MIDSCLEMSNPMKSEFLLVREVESKLYGLRCTKQGQGFEIRLHLGDGYYSYRSGNREVTVEVSHNGNYSIDFLEDNAFYPKEGYFTKVNLLGEARLVADQIIDFLYPVHLAKSDINQTGNPVTGFLNPSEVTQ